METVILPMHLHIKEALQELIWVIEKQPIDKPVMLRRNPVCESAIFLHAKKVSLEINSMTPEQLADCIKIGHKIAFDINPS